MMNNTNTQAQKSVFVALVGRPNAGKSSLLNRLVGEKVAIVTPKPQTTRTRITGVITKENLQYVFLDTPGVHKARTLLGQRMNKAVRDTMQDGDAVLMLFEPLLALNDAETETIEAIKAAGVPAIAVVNKKDIVTKETDINSKIAELEETQAFSKVVAVSAATGENCSQLLELLIPFMAEGPHYFGSDDYTDQPEKQIVAELVREKILLYMQEEIPHGTNVEVERFRDRENQEIIDIDVVIYCEKKSHKGMIIGKGGQMLKKIASAARADCEEFLDTKVNMQCWVKVKTDWRDDDRMLNSFGFNK